MHVEQERLMRASLSCLLERRKSLPALLCSFNNPNCCSDTCLKDTGSRCIPTSSRHCCNLQRCSLRTTQRRQQVPGQQNFQRYPLRRVANQE
ncbi:hypothetical protein B0O99DRAFT_637376 [Bisporella sp. PMI_857]|nr:hypothetical protein B0O99DRAFT_637376 [Bisporella sp. PMI_857]